MSEALSQLLSLSHQIGRAGDLAILGEGNTSARTGDDSMIVKASGSSLADLTAEQVTECRISTLLEAIDAPEGRFSDIEVDEKLMASRVSPTSRKPSVEAYFHAYLLTLPGVKFVAHCHSEAVNGILCSPLAQQFARQRQCPDEVVCCGGESLYVPYVDPGLRLARVLRTEVRALVQRTGRLPKVILLGNHGVICPAGSVNGAWAALAMCVKAARVFTAAVTLGGVRALPQEDIDRLEGRPDEHHRRAVLGI